MKARKLKATDNYEVLYKKPLDLKVGERIQLFKKDVPEKWHGWNWCRDSRGNEGWISESYFKRAGNEATILRSYSAKELSVRAGDSLESIYFDCGWAWCKKLDGEEGWLPADCLVDDTTLSTDRLTIRGYRTGDWERVHIYGSDPDFSKYEFWGPNTIEDTQKFVGDMVAQAKMLPRFKFDFAVCLKSENILIGGCGIRRETEESRVANLGWAISPEFQNKGFATEAARALIEFGFSDLGLSVIYATCDTRNVASYKVMEKVGMKKVGFIKGTKEIKGYIRDSFRYEILAL